MADAPKVPFSKPLLSGFEMETLRPLFDGGQLCGDGIFTKQCEKLLESRLSCKKAFLTHSCTAALEMAAILLDLRPGDEVILPSFTFSSTANAIVLRGATPVFIDCDPLTMNMDIAQIEPAITNKTKAIFAVHYAGLAPDMHAISKIAQKHDLKVVEDAAQSLGASFNDEPAGTHSHLATLSFHETKNVMSGEGGALIVNDKSYASRAAILREKGTNRQAFKEGLVDKYSWVDIGSSYVPSELIAAVLLENLKLTSKITARRLEIWERYRESFQRFGNKGLQLPVRNHGLAQHNGHIFYCLLPNSDLRSSLLRKASARGVGLTFHYIPLHSAPAGKRFGRTINDCPKTEDSAARLIRLPMSAAFSDSEVRHVINVMTDLFEEML